MAPSDLDQLIEMGFDKERAELAVTKSGGLQGALEWLEANQDKSLEEIKAESKNDDEEEGPQLQPGEEARSLVCNECGKKFRSHAQAEFHASKSQHVDFSESTEELKPLTEEEKKAKLEDLRQKLAAKRSVQSVQDKIDQKRNEEIRRKSTKESQDAKEELQRKQMMKEAEKKKQEKLADIEAKRRVKAKIEADKEERRRKAERERAERAGVAPSAEPASAPSATSSGPSTSKPASAYTETRLRFQTPKGNILKTLPVTTTLFEVAAALKQEDGIDVQSFLQTFPRKVFDSEYYGESLKDLGLTPSASLVVHVGDQHRGNPTCIMMPNTTDTTSANPFEERPRRMNEYTAREIATLQARLDKKLGPEYISSRPGAAGQRVHYLAADKCINLANEVFGFNGWSSSIQQIQIDFVDESPNTGKISLGLSVVVRVTLKDGTYHEDIGYGHIENCKGKAAAFEKAKKEGTTDALKRTLRNFGNVLGNCIYDKDYVSKVTKVKTAPARWDVDDLHRHPDFAPIKKEPVQQKPMQEDDDLPPRPTDAGKNNSNSADTAFDADGEFGSDLFDEADFGVAATGNPDEIVIDPDTQRFQQPPTPLNRQNGPAPYRGPQQHNPLAAARPHSAIATPSKPERPPNQAAAARQIPPPALNGRPNPAAPAHNPQHNLPSGRIPPAQPRPNQDTAMPGASGQMPIKREQVPNPNDPGTQDMLPPGSSPMPSASFFSARAVDLLRDNPQANAAPAFDPHAESPSIRKTAGVDHSKSVPISKPMLASVSPAANNTRDFVNPSQDMHRKIGAPSGIGSPMNRGQTTSSYRPLTRPNIDPKNAVNTTAANRGVGPQNLNGKRPPLSDVTNASTLGGSGPAPIGGAIDPKRPKINDGPLPHQQQQHPQ
ncbi:DNA recombination/repair protein Rad52 [Aspergillus oryzae]|uniref:RAD52 homolog n=2 Tax=Aspergillus oryzae TaxID=5062 RepID=A0A1S9DZL9_ASPOZ|nr:uncharacterized protein G4B84_004970 [Aspergillus flavus NRRL3357]KAF7618346.1 hypothetical protein AFLA_007243 [Aspergillus flavus NRRL3357]OOO14413.1 DNA recombination/repair protein Rad52 [Aspergillus oryzae]QMW29635.1 hypothetical protein G4B84_004970 [Aspergillus flavus NRRL3357]QMW41707.1 hypothetical protein G4B11_005031 [Aspergillus flavus]